MYLPRYVFRGLAVTNLHGFIVLIKGINCLTRALIDREIGYLPDAPSLLPNLLLHFPCFFSLPSVFAPKHPYAETHEISLGIA